jgi:hypothetical protein
LAHAALAVLAASLAVPLGIGLYLALFRIAGDTSEEALIAPWWSLALVPIGTLGLRLRLARYASAGSCLLARSVMRILR